MAAGDILEAETNARDLRASPRHVALIMDGNGRWAAARGLPRFEGHRRGVEALRRAVRAAINLRIDYLTVYSFSAENWSRPREEVEMLLGLLHRFIRNDLAELHASNVRVRVIGARGDLAPEILDLLREAEQVTQANAGLTLVVAFNYGARQEIAAAARALAEMVALGRLAPGEIDAEAIAAQLDTADIPDPDLIIRTSGEQRLSNFLLWQAAYAEFVFLPILWPDFDEVAFIGALAEYGHRDRRFGGLDAAAPGAKTAS
ncbi:isoprenyl transferase [Methylocystis sp. 9N]|uniref:Isoprenyl transferase n=1 Tax=Methylocystis borbori TaxID=3118750 RepID=A0ABU7XK23_9HYPH